MSVLERLENFRMPEEHQNRSRETLAGGIFVRLAAVLLVGQTGIYALEMSLSVAWLLALLANPFAFWYDRKYVSRELGWKPSILYLFAGPVPFLGIFTTAYYLNKRRKKFRGETAG